MNKAAAMKIAHSLAWKVLQGALDNGRIADWLDNRGLSEEDADRVDKAYDTLIQRHFDQSED